MVVMIYIIIWYVINVYSVSFVIWDIVNVLNFVFRVSVSLFFMIFGYFFFGERSV